MRYLLLLSTIVLAGCATLEEGEAEATEKKLQEAGFQVHTADNPSARSAIAASKPYRLQVSADRRLYRYADPRRNRLYLGDEQAYQAYLRLETKTHSRRATNLAQMSNRRVDGPLVW